MLASQNTHLNSDMICILNILISMAPSTSNFDAAFSSNSTFASSYILLPTLKNPVF